MKLRNGILTAVICGLALAGLLAPGPAGAVVVRGANGRFQGITPRVAVPAHAVGSVPKGRALHTSNNGNLDYNRGSVLHSSAPYLIFWDPSAEISSTSRDLLERYFTDVAADSEKATNVYAVDRQFTDGSGFADYRQTFSPGQVIVDTQPYPSRDIVNCPDTASTYPNCLTDAQLQSEVTRLIDADGLPTGTAANAPIYFIVTPGDTNICNPDGSIPVPCADNVFCAYHGSFALSGSGATVLYAAIPMFFDGASSAQDPKACQYDGNSAVQEPNGDIADVAIKYMSHEDNESITDPTGSGWWDNNTGYEDGDNCNDIETNSNAFTPTLGGDPNAGTLYNQVINGHHYYIQSEWSNGDVNCEMQPTSGSITDDFSSTNSTRTGTAFNFDPSGSTSSRGFSSASWDFGDGGNAFALGSPAGVAHTYASDGNYTVKLTLVDVAGNLVTTTRSITVGPAPTAAFTFTPNTPAAHDLVTFNGSGSSDPNSSPLTYMWNFGDASATGSGVSPTHAYSAPGNYTVTLTATNNDNLSDTITHVVNVGADEVPTAAFVVQSHHPQAGVPVSFSGSASRDPDGTIAAYAWNFGDGSAAAFGAAPQHVYARKGSYTVTLTVRDSSGQYAVSSQTVKVLAPVITTSYKHGILRITVQQAGTITIGSRHKSRSRPGTVKFKLRLSHHDQTLLRSRHSLKLKLKIAFAPTLAHATNETIVVKLKS
jgi:PKD repeat protein